MSAKTRKWILLILCTAASVACLVSLVVLGRVGSGAEILGIPRTAFVGTLSALAMLFGVLTVFADYKVGGALGGVLILAATGSNVSKIVMTGSLQSLPGLVSSAMSALAAIVVFVAYRRSAKRARVDFVTDVGNRRAFVEDVEARISEGRPFHLACVELESFKHINDIYGIQTGDFILRKSAENIVAVAGRSDTVYRMTGATFAIIVDGVVPPEQMLADVVRTGDESIPIPSHMVAESEGEKSCKIPLFVGASAYPADSSDSTELLKHADIALSCAKKRGERKACFFDSTLENEELKRLEAELLVRESLEKGYFYLVYQPQYTLAGKTLRGFETLIRCRRPDGSLVSPGYFIPAAEQSGLIFEIDDYVLRRAMREFKPVVDRTGRNIIVSVNVSAKNASSPGFAGKVLSLLSETGFPPFNLEIEITEYSLAESLDTTVENIAALREKGVQIALDDFGTGYTSIAQLLKLPINLLKIDKSLIDGIESNQMNRDLVDSVIYMGHVMNCEVISEGVESERQLALLAEHKCDFVQGFVWGRPMDYAQAADIVPK